MTRRVHNFNAGPAGLPLPVLEQVRRDLLDFEGTGMSILEMSHRGGAYERVHDQAIQDLRTLLGLSDEYSVLFMGGGARTQFALLPLNFLPKDQHGEYITTGYWSELALAEARRLGDAREIWSSASSNHDRVPAPSEVRVDPTAAYLHYTSNNTIYGTQYPEPPEAGPVPLVSDLSSEILSRPLDVSQFALFYAGAQKNLGPAGVTVVVAKKSFLERARKDGPEIWSYAKIAAKNSLLNTPPVFAVYVVGLVAKHLLESGGVSAQAARNEEKARLLYGALDRSNGFYRGCAQPGSRSNMNVTFRLPTLEMESRFIAEATLAGLIGLKGHRAVGGIRASLYNAVSAADVRALIEFMDGFWRPWSADRSLLG